MRRILSALTLCLVLCSSHALAASSPATLQGWISQIKQEERGPFSRLRWFCADGQVLPPRPYACSSFGGGVQHGEWTERVKAIRDEGYYIANFLAGGHGADLPLEVGKREELVHILLEKFLVGYDDGWIYRRARTYRGAMQVEDETSASQTLLYRMAQMPSLPNQDFLLLRQSLMLLPGNQDTSAAETVRQLSAQLAERDRGFESFRAKIHGQPQMEDAAAVRDYVRRTGERDPRYEQLASAIERLFSDAGVAPALEQLEPMLRSAELRQQIRDLIPMFRSSRQLDARLLGAGHLMAALRQAFPYETASQVRLVMLRTSMSLEQELLRSGHTLMRSAPQAPRSSYVMWLSALNDGLYGSGVLSARQWMGNGVKLRALAVDQLSVAAYRENLRYLGRTASWATEWFDFHFGEGVRTFSRLEPKIREFVPDRLRGSPLLVFTTVLDQLTADANDLAGVDNRLFGESIGAAMRPLNAGLARGKLYLNAPDNAVLDPSGIYVMPETTAEMTPVAGILTRGAGNSLSHVQLLASNLGIPNVVVDDRLLKRLGQYEGKTVVMAVSPGGAVALSEDSSKWDAVFGAISADSAGKLSPDISKLDLTYADFTSLSKIRAKDSGRICGPKAANLGELKFQFPGTVTEGLVVPFSRFRALLAQPHRGQGESVYDWMIKQYELLQSLEGRARAQQTTTFLKQMRDIISASEPGRVFRQELAAALEKEFGAEGSYAVFVRSDTNVEDLAGFTGAGLNLTKPNVRGFDNIVDAILEVWSSPFTDRAFSWRQQRMDHPEWVYPSVLLLKSVPADKSGVMLTVDPETGHANTLTIAVNYGVGGAVAGESAEELSIRRDTGIITVLGDATEPTKRVLQPGSGLVNVAVPADGDVLEVAELEMLNQLATQVAQRFPQLDEGGRPGPADIEFGFRDGKLVLFQIRPFLANKRAKKTRHLLDLDSKATKGDGLVLMRQRIGGQS